ncbi:MAG: flavodoxin family protein [Lachnospiraceae bacterium]|nr:flavodoxin family protein [Lachnospiraceae bacterium]
MKVLLMNGSRRENGCTYTALNEVASALAENGIESEQLFIGKAVMEGRVNEIVQEAAAKMKECDGLVVGSPVYYASATGEVQMVLDRLFGVARADLSHKPAAAVVSARRGGTAAAMDNLNKYFMISEMPVVSSCYWNMVFGNTPEEVMQDAEGLRTMRLIGHNMAWLLKCIEAGKAAGVERKTEPAAKTNFIR